MARGRLTDVRSRLLLAVLVLRGWASGSARWALRRGPRQRATAVAEILVRGTSRAGQARRVGRGMVVEQSIQWTLFPHFRLLRGAPLRGVEHLEEAERPGKGSMLVTTHCGWIQALLWCLADHGKPITCVSGGWIVHSTRPTDVRQMPMVNDAIAMGTRHIVTGTGAFAQLNEVISSRGRALMAVDMPGSLEVTYLDKPAKVGQASFRIAWDNGCPVVPVGIRRRGLRVVVEALPALWPSAFDSYEKFVQAGMDAVSAHVLPDAQEYTPRNVAILWPGGDAANSRPNRVAWSEKTGTGA